MDRIVSKKELLDIMNVKKKISQNIYIQNVIFTEEINFEGSRFRGTVLFKKCHFRSIVNFHEATFEDEVRFDGSVFEKNANFSEVKFEGDTYFRDVEFREFVSFENSEAKEGSIDFNNIKFSKANFEKILFLYPNFINMHPYPDENTSFSTKNFSSKESVRVIRAALDEKRNTVEATQYFIVEQDFFLQAITSKNQWIKSIPLVMDKLFSNYGTDYKKVLISFALYYIVMYCITQNIILPNLCLSHKEFLEILIPLKTIGLNINGSNLDKHIITKTPLIFVIFIRLSMLYFFYQFIRAFRVDTKRV